MVLLDDNNYEHPWFYLIDDNNYDQIWENCTMYNDVKIVDILTFQMCSLVDHYSCHLSNLAPIADQCGILNINVTFICHHMISQMRKKHMLSRIELV